MSYTMATCEKCRGSSGGCTGACNPDKPWAGSIQVLPRAISDAEWVEALTLAMKADLGAELRKRTVTELLEMRGKQKFIFAANPPKTPLNAL